MSALTVLTSGSILGAVIDIADALRLEQGIAVRVLSVPCLKPLDSAAIRRARTPP
ncbi:MAG: transketolase family protein, partial [Polyangiaceae bacterium]|nr:transketolase family protein [Polyangiaceae bacterium]